MIRLSSDRLILSLSLALAGCDEGPERSVRSLGQAFTDQDRLKVTRYMDVDRTAGSITSAIVAEVTRQTEQDSTLNSGLMSGFGTAMLGAMQPALTAYIREMILYVADSTAAMPGFMGATDSSELSRRHVRDSLAAGLEVREGRVEGDVALVPVFFPAGPGRLDSGTAMLRLERGQKNWRVVGIEHLPEAVFAPVRKRIR